jgi:hypothetical protein
MKDGIQREEYLATILRIKLHDGRLIPQINTDKRRRRVFMHEDDYCILQCCINAVALFLLFH